MKTYGFDFPTEIRKTYLYDLEENWYLPLLAKLKNIPVQSVKRSNFGQYDMAVNYLTSVLEEAAAVNKVAIYNIDHMAQLRFWGKDAAALLHRSLGANILEMKIGSCKYTLLLNEEGGVQDDMILMRVSDQEFILVINAGHDITGEGEEHGEKVQLIADIDRIMRNKQDGEDVMAEDISDTLVKVDIQGPLSYKLIKEIYGADVLKNRSNPEKNMNFFTFNEIDIDGHRYYFSRTGYTNRWGWECYIPVAKAEEDFKKIVSRALELGGLLVGLGGRDENRISAGAFGLPLMGQEYDPHHNPVNAPLFEAAVDMSKEDFAGKAALAKAISSGVSKRMFIIISEGIVSGRGVYLNGQRLGSVTSSINSPNLSLEQRLAIGSKRKNVNDEHGTAAIGLVWLNNSVFDTDAEGKDIVESAGTPVRIKVEFYREDAEAKPTGSPVLGYITQEGICPATAPKALKNIENL
ncbi:MAG: aminomethyl transferase family protein [Candidatus Cloacimonetes bacterium]|jgi:aminomethyltransferase|nr:aminomethyl transferase family protein [Candidatus Cloacimonadota bacterium]MDY0336933.1 aminomethyl transferase family protein [Candidatus Cloacimonadaceae bacterium]MCB5268537.1 aminomethyl transferase family protein [Candidatus Cloacimonadota bacterium]MCK9335530.1 aminomethyl transferase family protein [Candidatus Cloacimonadota bacterium]MDD2543026.1 aminomethyl transferase family protein [Candidatus Cloacimonadota bacterium]